MVRLSVTYSTHHEHRGYGCNTYWDEEGNRMAGIGWFIMALGFVMQVLIPLGIFGRPDGLIVGIPTQLFFVFIATWVLVGGLVIVYFSWLRPYARRLDASLNVEE